VTTPTPTRPPEGRPDRPSAASTTPSAAPAGERRPRTASRRFVSPIEYDDESFVRIGVVVPFDFGLDWEYWGYLPSAVELHFTRTPYLDKPVGVGLARAVARPKMVERATRSLAALRPAVTVYACSSGSFVDGPAAEERLRQTMLAAGAAAAVTSAGAMVEALRAVEAHRVAVATPYDRRLTNRLVDFLGESGFDVPSVTHLGMRHDIARVAKPTIAELVRAAAHPDADAVFLSCTSLRSRGMIAGLEQEIGCPILTSNQVTLWAALARADALPDDPSSEVKGWVLGGGDPMAESTELLLAHGGAAD
jgi:maleate isomerase